MDLAGFKAKTMAFILSTDLPDPNSKIYLEKQRENWQLYQQYLQDIKTKLQPAAGDFALAEWHYNYQDPRCPHDAWLESLIIREPSQGERHQHRSLELVLRLLGAYHDGYIEITYRDVVSYRVERGYNEAQSLGHGDWLVDEIGLSPRNKVTHEIEWWINGRFMIECADIEYKWLPINA